MHSAPYLTRASNLAFVLADLVGSSVVPTSDGILTIAPAKLPELESVPHAFPYQGSKRALAHAILRFIPSDTTCLIEPFAGSAAISMAVSHTKRAEYVVLGDVNGPLMALWDEIIYNPNGLADRYESLWNSSGDSPEMWKAFFLQQRAEFNQTGDPALLLYLLNRIVKGAVRYSKDGSFNQSADNRRRGARPEVVRERLCKSSLTLGRARVTSGSYEPLLLDAAPTDVCYMDPPYQGVSDVADHRYAAGLRRTDYEEVLESAVHRGISFMVSYDAVTPDGRYGEPLSAHLGLTHLHIAAGASAQATLSGRSAQTIESLYLSPVLAERLMDKPPDMLF